jgi:hypothetical protein
MAEAELTAAVVVHIQREKFDRAWSLGRRAEDELQAVVTLGGSSPTTVRVPI